MEVSGRQLVVWSLGKKDQGRRLHLNCILFGNSLIGIFEALEVQLGGDIKVERSEDEVSQTSIEFNRRKMTDLKCQKKKSNINYKESQGNVVDGK